MRERFVCGRGIRIMQKESGEGVDDSIAKEWVGVSVLVGRVRVQNPVSSDLAVKF